MAKIPFTKHNKNLENLLQTLGNHRVRKCFGRKTHQWVPAAVYHIPQLHIKHPALHSPGGTGPDQLCQKIPSTTEGSLRKTDGQESQEFQ